MAQAIRDEVIEELLQGYRSPDDLLGEEGLFKELKKRLLELIAAVHAADGEIDFAEDDHLRAVGAALGLPDDSYKELVVDIVEEIDLGDDLERIRYG